MLMDCWMTAEDKEDNKFRAAISDLTIASHLNGGVRQQIAMGNPVELSLAAIETGGMHAWFRLGMSHAQMASTKTVVIPDVTTKQILAQGRHDVAALCFRKAMSEPEPESPEMVCCCCGGVCISLQC